MPQNISGNGSITRTTLAEAVSHAVPGMNKRQAAELVEQIISVMRETLATGEEIKISGFGKFITQDKKARRGRNPKTGEPLTITPRRVVKFRAGDTFREELNSHAITAKLMEERAQTVDNEPQGTDLSGQ